MASIRCKASRWTAGRAGKWVTTNATAHRRMLMEKLLAEDEAVEAAVAVGDVDAVAEQAARVEQQLELAEIEPA